MMSPLLPLDHPPDADCGHALIIEDNALNSEVLAVLLGLEGVTSTIVETPRRLRETLDQLYCIDVIFLDLEFRDYDGFEVHRQLKDDPRLKDVPVVAYTVHTSEIDRARREGFHSFLGKPIEPSVFGQHLNRILHNQPVWEI